MLWLTVVGTSRLPVPQALHVAYLPHEEPKGVINWGGK